MIVARHATKGPVLKHVGDEMLLDDISFSKSIDHAVLTACAVTYDSELTSELVASLLDGGAESGHACPLSRA